MDFPAPVGNQFQTPNPTASLSSYLGIRQQQQNLQTGQYRQQSAQATAQQDQQTSQQRQAAAQFFQNYDVAAHVGPDGTLDLDQALTHPGLKATGDAYPIVAKSLIDMKNAQLDGKSKLAGLNGTLRQQFYDNVGGLSDDPDVKAGNATGTGKVLDAIDQFSQSGGPDAARVAAVYKPVIQNLTAAGKAAKLPEVLRNFQLQSLDAGKQIEQTSGTPGTLDSGGAIIPGVQAPAAAGGGFTPAGPGVSKTLPPGIEIVTDSNKHQYAFDRQNNTVTPIGAGPHAWHPLQARPAPPTPTVQDFIPGSATNPPGSGAPAGQASPMGPGAQGAPQGPPVGMRQPAPQAPPAPPGLNRQPPVNGGFAQPVPDQDRVMGEIEGARKAGSQVGINRYVNSELLRLSGNTSTGPGTAEWHNILGGIGAPFGGSLNADYQLIGAYLDRQAAQNSEAMGLPTTNAGLATSQSLSGNTNYTPKALQAKVRLNDAINTAADQYRQGIDKAVGTGNTPNYGAYQAFRSAWSSNYDPRVFALENAHRNGDKEEANRILKDLKPADRAALMQKRAALNALSQGQIPQ